MVEVKQSQACTLLKYNRKVSNFVCKSANSLSNILFSEIPNSWSSLTMSLASVLMSFYILVRGQFFRTLTLLTLVEDFEMIKVQFLIINPLKDITALLHVYSLSNQIQQYLVRFIFFTGSDMVRYLYPSNFSTTLLISYLEIDLGTALTKRVHRSWSKP